VLVDCAAGHDNGAEGNEEGVGDDFPSILLALHSFPGVVCGAAVEGKGEG
jgi:hypothetical protein